MPCSTRMRREECALALAFVDLLVPARWVLLELAMWWRDDAAACLGAQPLIAGISEISTKGPSARCLTRPSWRAWVMSAQVAGWAGLQNRSLPVASVRPWP